ncbi:MAG TPA: YibE/F family protein, partial [Blastococcus sp.]
MPPHSHGSDTDVAPPSTEAVGLRRRAVWLMLLFLVPVGLATVIGLIVLWPGDGPTKAEEAAATYLPPGTTYP